MEEWYLKTEISSKLQRVSIWDVHIKRSHRIAVHRSVCKRHSAEWAVRYNIRFFASNQVHVCSGSHIYVT